MEGRMGEYYYYNCIVPVGFLPWETQVAFPWESQLRQSHYLTYDNGAIIHQTLTLITGSLTCAQMLMHAIAHGCMDTIRESTV